ncbi:hypothetical protein DFH09DRAFT_1095896 [Mycena vulgaris]|nr:hypothetical protein DFH09DRAFT_1095896 [Mycena vulgaris]
MRAGAAPIKNLSADIVSYIMDLAGPVASNKLSRTCKSFDASFKTHMLSKTYQVLNNFDIPPREFIRYLALTSSVIARSVPANILAGDKFEPSDLDVITLASEKHSMQTVMEETIGFELINIVVPGGMQGTLRRVYVYSHDGKHQTTDVLHKYISRGVAFKTDDKKWPDLVRIHKCHRSPTCSHTLRSIGDASGPHIPFPVDYKGFAGDGLDSIAPNINQTTTWSIGGDFRTNSKLYIRASSQHTIIHQLCQRQHSPLWDEEDVSWTSGTAGVGSDSESN